MHSASLSHRPNTRSHTAPPMKDRCPNCTSTRAEVFYEVRDVPVHSVLLVRTRAEALAFPRGHIALSFCPDCGFIFNSAFDPSRLNYSAEYEETQGFSSTFNSFHRRLALDLITRYDLHGKDVIEVGCGKGEFLTLLCELGGNRGLGFDPAYVPERNNSQARDRITFIRDFYSEKYARHAADFLCCKMTLEHIDRTAAFIRTVRRSVETRPGTVVFFQIPEAQRILRGEVFWDIYYEHCSYFSPGSLGRLFRRCGFDVLNLWTDYDDQYLMIEARVAEGTPTPALPAEEAPEVLALDVRLFTETIVRRLDAWRTQLAAYRDAGKRVVLWGGGSKAVAFLTTLGVTDEVACAVDINPYKHGTYLAGSGHEIVGPEALVDLKPDVVLVMNPVYHDEIARDLAGLGLSPTLLDIEQPAAA